MAMVRALGVLGMGILVLISGCVAEEPSDPAEDGDEAAQEDTTQEPGAE